jgi:hypothetical protein
MLFAACDAMGAVGGEAWLSRHGLPVVGMSGLVTTSPLQCQECTEVTGLPIYTRHDLAQPRTAMKILGMAESQRQGHDGGSGSTPARTEAR